VLVFVFYTLTKSLIITILIAVFAGLPALVVAFGKVNGRPIYMAFGNFINYFTGSKEYIFHKQAKSLPSDFADKVVIKEQAPAAVDAKSAVLRIKQLNYLLQQQASEEQTLLERVAVERIRERNKK
jgi:hypothetical protein